MKAKHMSFTDFMKQSFTEKINTVKSLTKRANVRLKALEDKGLTDLESYQVASIHNSDNGKISNRYYQGGKYESEKDVVEMFNNVNTFLENKSSTLGGVDKSINESIHKQLDLDGKINVNYIDSLTNTEKKYANKALADIANTRIKEINDRGLRSKPLDIAKQYNEEMGMKSGKFTKRNLSSKKLDINLQKMTAFINSNGSIANKIQERRDKTINTFRKNGIKIADKDIDNFFDFLSSERFSNIRKNVDSGQIIESFVDALNKEIFIDEINNAFDEFKDGDMKYDELLERLGTAPWLD